MEYDLPHQMCIESFLGDSQASVSYLKKLYAIIECKKQEKTANSIILKRRSTEILSF